MHDDERALRTMHAEWIAAVNAGDLAYLLGHMTEDSVFLSPGQAPIRHGEFRTGFEAGHREYALHCASEVMEATVVGDLAHTVCRDTLTLVPRDGGATQTLAGHRLSLYRKTQDGRWQLARDAHTLVPAAE